MLTKQLREMERQATVTQTRVQRFIALQTQINNQIDTVGQADIQLAGELDYIGDQLSNDEINQICDWYNNQHDIID